MDNKSSRVTQDQEKMEDSGPLKRKKMIKTTIVRLESLFCAVTVSD